MVGPEFLYSIYVEKSEFLHKVASRRVFYGHDFIEERIYVVLEAERLLPQVVRWRHSMKRVLSEPLQCVGSGTASSASHCVAPLYEAGT